MTPSPLGPCRKEVLGGITPKGDIPSLNFFEGALRAPLGPPGPGALAPATPSLGGPGCVARRYSVKTAKHIIRRFSASGRHTTIYFSLPNPMAIFQWGPL